MGSLVDGGWWLENYGLIRIGDNNSGRKFSREFNSEDWGLSRKGIPVVDHKV